MPSVQGGGGLVSGSNIVDGTVADADIATNAAISLSKLSGLIGNPGSFISFDISTTGTYALTTLANERVLVLATCEVVGLSTNMTQTLKYNAVTKDTRIVRTGNSGFSGSCMLAYTEVPGAATQNITVNSDASLSNSVIVVIKLKVG